MLEIILLLSALCLNTLHGFPPRVITGLGIYTRTHSDILHFAFNKAVAQFFKDNYLDFDVTAMSDLEIIVKFFGDDADGKQKYDSSVEDILSFLEKEEKSKDAEVHCNGEQFLQAHTRIVKFRNMIKELAKETNPDITLIRKYVGQSLYTINAFYSTSNWIEMFGNKTYKDFGVPGRTLMPVAPHDVDTCSNCDNSGNIVDSCKNNLLVTDLLTSGYRSGESAPSPRRDDASTTGKCGFGGSSDSENGKTTATGGINKDRPDSSYSPHHKRHGEAFLVARDATFQFMIDPDIGLINELGKYMFAKVFNLNKRYKGSFGFAIDVTGSMGDDIANVKKTCTDIVTDVRGTINAPADYVLTTFSDPKTLTSLVLKTDDGLQMTKAIQNLQVSGGDDCPEYSMSGLLKCIEACKEKSIIFLFTDASAKDALEKDNVIYAAKNKNIKIFFVLTRAECSRRKRSTGINKRETSVYDSIAQETGGKVYRITTQDISSAMKEVVDEYFPSATSILDTFTSGLSDSNFMNFVVDKSVENIKITIIGAFGTSEVNISNSSGSIAISNSTKLIFESPNKVILSLVAPPPGEYTINRLVTRIWTVTITGQSNVDFNYYILEEYEKDYWYRTSENPIRGVNYTLEIVLYNLPSNGSIQAIELTDNSGKKFSYNFTYGSLSYATTSVFTQVVFDSESYKVGIRGFDSDGNEFQRAAVNMIYPVDVKLEISSPAELITDTLTSVPYTVHNMGSLNDTYLVTVQENRGFTIANTTSTYYISARRSISSEFEIQGSSAYKTVTYTVKVQSLASGKILQQQSRTVFVNANKPPECSLTETFGNCSLVFYDGTCSSEKWYGNAKIKFGTEITSVEGTNGLHLEYDYTGTTSLAVNVSSDCCTSYGYVTVIDKNNNMQRCYFNTGKPVYLSETQPVLSTSAKIAIGVVAGIVIVCLVAVTVMVIIVYRTGVKPTLDKMRINDLNIKASKDLPVRSDKSSRSRFTDDFSALKYDFDNLPPRDTKMPPVTAWELE